MILFTVVLLYGCVNDSSQVNIAEDKFNRLIDDLSNQDMVLDNIYENHFQVKSNHRELAIEVLDDLRTHLKTKTTKTEDIKLLEYVDGLNESILNAAYGIGVDAVYQALLSEGSQKIYFGLENGRLVLFIPINNGQKGVMTI